MRIGRIVGMVAWCLLAVVAFVTAQGGRMEFAGVDITGTGATALDVAGGIQAGSGNVGIVDSTGKIPAISSTYFASLSGANLTGVPESAITDGTTLARVAGNETITGNWTFQGSLIASGLAAGIRMVETDATTNEGAWLLYADGDQFNIGTLNDSGSLVSLPLQIDRSGTSASTWQFSGSEFTFADGRINSNTSQPWVIAYNSADDTEAGESASVEFDTEVKDQSSSFTSSTFTAPATGSYHVCAWAEITNDSGLTDTPKLQIITSNRTYQFDAGSVDDAALVTPGGCTDADMDASDTLTVSVNTGLSGFVVGGGSSPLVTWLTIRLTP